MDPVDKSEAFAPNQSPVVVAAVDESSTAEGVMERARWLATNMKAVLHMVRVIEVVPTVGLGDSSLLIPSAARLVQQAWLDLERLMAAEGERTIETKGHVTIGASSQKILQLVNDLEADVLVIGTHNPSKVASALFGSTATELVRQAPCPVFVVRPKHHHHVPLPCDSWAGHAHFPLR